MSRNTGKPSEQKFVEIYKKLGKRAFVHRVVDAAEVRGRTKNGAAWVRKQPSDWLVTEDGIMFYGETKSSSNKTSFPFSDITPHQKGSARKQIAAGGEYYFFIHRLATDDWYKLPAQVVLDSEKSSIKWTELEPYKWELAYA